jgi:hypothetical protein
MSAAVARCVLLQMYDDAVTYCPLDGLLKLRKRPRSLEEAQPEEVGH